MLTVTVPARSFHILSGIVTLPVCLIHVDVHEPDEGVAPALRELGVEVVRRHLTAGDFDLGSGILVERKTVPDLHLSLQRGRLWPQIGNVRRTARLPYLLIEGRELDLPGGVRPESIRGACLAVIGQGVPILRSNDAADSARWLCLLARRGTTRGLRRDRPAYAQRLKGPEALAREAMLAAVPGISVETARALLNWFGSVAAVINAGEDALREVPGVGLARAGALRDAVS